MKARIKEYDALRVVLTLLVIAGHSTYLLLSTKYGGISYRNDIVSSGYELSSLYIFFDHINEFIYLFHMEIFMLLSGTLFEREINKYDARTLATKKAKKLLLPFIITLSLIVIPIKLLTGYWATSSNVFKDILIGQFLLQGNIYLWFLPVLFTIFFIVYFLVKKKADSKIVGTFFLILYFLSNLIKIRFAMYIFKYLIWFYLGIIFNRNRSLINKHISLKNTLFSIIGVSGACIAYSLLPPYAQILIKPIITVLMVFIIYAACCSYSKKWSGKSIILKHSFALYLLADPVNYIFLFLVFKLCPLSIFSSNMWSLLIIVLRFFAQLIVSLAVIMIIKTIKKHITNRIIYSKSL